MTPMKRKQKKTLLKKKNKRLDFLIKNDYTMLVKLKKWNSSRLFLLRELTFGVS